MPVSYVIPEIERSTSSNDGGGTGQGGGRGVLCSVEQFARRATPFLSDPHSCAKVRRKQLVIADGVFCKTHATPRPPRKGVLAFLGGGRGTGTVARFSGATGELEVVDAKGEVIW